MKYWPHIVAVMSVAACAAASFAQTSEFAGKRFDIASLEDGKVKEFGSGKVDGLGVVTGAVGSLSITGTVTGRDWVLSCGAGSLSDSWDGRGALGQFDVSEGVAVRIAETGLSQPGEQTTWNSGVLTLLCVGVGMLIWFRFVSGFRRRSVDF